MPRYRSKIIHWNDDDYDTDIVDHHAFDCLSDAHIDMLESNEYYLERTCIPQAKKNDYYCEYYIKSYDTENKRSFWSRKLKVVPVASFYLGAIMADDKDIFSIWNAK